MRFKLLLVAAVLVSWVQLWLEFSNWLVWVSDGFWWGLTENGVYSIPPLYGQFMAMLRGTWQLIVDCHKPIDVCPNHKIGMVTSIIKQCFYQPTIIDSEWLQHFQHPNWFSKWIVAYHHLLHRDDSMATFHGRPSETLGKSLVCFSDVVPLAPRMSPNFACLYFWTPQCAIWSRKSRRKLFRPRGKSLGSPAFSLGLGNPWGKSLGLVHGDPWWSMVQVCEEALQINSKSVKAGSDGFVGLWW